MKNIEIGILTNYKYTAPIFFAIVSDTVNDKFLKLRFEEGECVSIEIIDIKHVNKFASPFQHDEMRWIRQSEIINDVEKIFLVAPDPTPQSWATFDYDEEEK